MEGLLFNGNRLKELRESKNLSMKDIEELTGIKQSTQSDLELNKNRNPRPVTVGKLCGALGVDPIYFYYAGNDLGETFLKQIPQDIREFIFNIENLEYLKLAKKIKDLGVKADSAENILTVFAKAVAMNTNT